MENLGSRIKPCGERIENYLLRIKDQFLRKIIGNNDNTSLETAVLT